jgi:hypothetical protein
VGVVVTTIVFVFFSLRTLKKSMTQREKMGEEIRSADAHVHARSLSLSRTTHKGIQLGVSYCHHSIKLHHLVKKKKLCF